MRQIKVHDFMSIVTRLDLWDCDGLMGIKATKIHNFGDLRL